MSTAQGRENALTLFYGLDSNSVVTPTELSPVASESRKWVRTALIAPVLAGVALIGLSNLNKSTANADELFAADLPQLSYAANAGSAAILAPDEFAAASAEADTKTSPFIYNAETDPANNPNKELPHDFGVSLVKGNIEETTNDWKERLTKSPLQLSATMSDLGAKAGFEIGSDIGAIDRLSDQMKADPALWEANYLKVMQFLKDNLVDADIETIKNAYESFYNINGKIGKAQSIDLGGSKVVYTYKGLNGHQYTLELRIECGGQNMSEEAPLPDVVVVTETIVNEVTEYVEVPVEVPGETVTSWLTNVSTVNGTPTTVLVPTTITQPGTTETETATETSTETSITTATTTATTTETTTTTETAKGTDTEHTPPETVVSTTTETVTAPGATIEVPVPGPTVTTTETVTAPPVTVEVPVEVPVPGPTVTTTETVTVTATPPPKGPDTGNTP